MASEQLPEYFDSDEYVDYLKNELDTEEAENLANLFQDDIGEENWKRSATKLRELDGTNTRPVIERLMATPTGRLSMARMSARTQELLEEILEPSEERITVDQRMKVSALLNGMAEYFAYLGANQTFFEKEDTHGSGG